MEKENRGCILYTNRLVPVAVLCWICAILAVPGLLSFDSLAFADMLVQMGIADINAAQSSLVIFALLGFMMVLWPGILAVCLTLVLVNRPGFSTLSKILDVFAKMIRILRYILTGYFVYQVILYIIECLPEDLVVYLIVGMLLFEGLLFAGFYFSVQLLIKFFSNAADALASLQYVQYSGKLEYSSAYVTVNRVLVLLGILGAGIGVYIGIFPFVAWPCIASLVLTAVANVWLSILLKKCQIRISYAAYLLAKEKNQSER